MDKTESTANASTAYEIEYPLELKRLEQKIFYEDKKDVSVIAAGVEDED